MHLFGFSFNLYFSRWANSFRRCAQMIFSVMRFDNHVINIDFHLFVDHVMEEGNHGLLICCLAFLRLEGHYFVIECAPRGRESSLLIDLLLDILIWL